MITIPIAITVSVATTASLGSIQDQGHVLVFFLPVDFLQFSKHTQFKQSCTNHENSTVSQLLDYLRVGHQFDGRTVNQHIFVLFPYGIYYLFQPVVEQQFGGVGRYGADRKDVQIFLFRIGDNYFIEIVNPAAKIVAQPLGRRVDIG